MDLQAIYNRVCWNVFGDSTPVVSIATYLQGANGAIARAHYDIMGDWPYWFMETETTQAITAPTAAYNLPARFKQEISLRLLNATTGKFNKPLSRLGRGVSYSDYLDPADTVEYPKVYEIWNGQIVLKPIPSVNSTLYLRYYQYLAGLVNLTDHDALTDNPHGAEAIISRVIMDMASNIEYSDKYQPFMQRYGEAIRLLREQDQEYKRYGQESVPNVGL